MKLYGYDWISLPLVYTQVFLYIYYQSMAKRLNLGQVAPN